MGKSDKFPYVGTTYRLTEHFHYWTKHARLNAIAQPEQFVEIGEAGGEERHQAGRHREGQFQPRLHQGQGGGDQAHSHAAGARPEVDTIGIPIHWGYEGVAKKGFIANTLTPFVGDANTQTPEFKAFPVNVEKV